MRLRGWRCKVNVFSHISGVFAIFAMANFQSPHVMEPDNSSEIKITYRRTSRLSMRIGVGGTLLVSSPPGVPPDEIMRFVNSNREWIASARRRMSDKVADRDRFFARLPLATNEQARDASRRMNELIQPLVKRYSAIMGVRPSGIRYRATRSRWGSCRRSTGEVTFSVYLLLLPQWLAEHVVVHEMSHLIEPNHGPRFYRLMDRYFPRWKEARAETRRLLK